MQVKTKVKAEISFANHNETLVCGQKPTSGLKVKTGLKAGHPIQQTSPSNGVSP